MYTGTNIFLKYENNKRSGKRGRKSHLTAMQQSNNHNTARGPQPSNKQEPTMGPHRPQVPKSTLKHTLLILQTSHLTFLWGCVHYLINRLFGDLVMLSQLCLSLPYEQ